MPRKSRFKLPPIDPDGESIGQRLARLRRERGYTQTDLAQNVGIIQSLVSAYEVDKLRLSAEMAARLARALGVSSDDLLGLKPAAGNGKKPPRRILRRLQEIETLRPSEQRALFKIIDTFVRASRK